MVKANLGYKFIFLTIYYKKQKRKGAITNEKYI